MSHAIVSQALLHTLTPHDTLPPSQVSEIPLQITRLSASGPASRDSQEAAPLRISASLRQKLPGLCFSILSCSPGTFPVLLPLLPNTAILQQSAKPGQANKPSSSHHCITLPAPRAAAARSSLLLLGHPSEAVECLQLSGESLGWNQHPTGNLYRDTLTAVLMPVLPQRNAASCQGGTLPGTCA